MPPEKPSAGDPNRDLEDQSELEECVVDLIKMLDHEVGRRWMTMQLRFKIEEIEIMLGRRGTAPGVPA